MVQIVQHKLFVYEWLPQRLKSIFMIFLLLSIQGQSLISKGRRSIKNSPQQYIRGIWKYNDIFQKLFYTAFFSNFSPVCYHRLRGNVASGKYESRLVETTTDRIRKSPSTSFNNHLYCKFYSPVQKKWYVLHSLEKRFMYDEN